ncbi:unnamed protein product [Prorocentrum cordatum]|uniref:Uncharacterized protein n=1 Tax=Prorocentrum cordatum TaxID=2364126 RepID=A0ABN9S0A7_9DINO|nr:unnamed protein product [Polarella glacialis]
MNALTALTATRRSKFGPGQATGGVHQARAQAGPGVQFASCRRRAGGVLRPAPSHGAVHPQRERTGNLPKGAFASLLVGSSLAAVAGRAPPAKCRHVPLQSCVLMTRVDCALCLPGVGVESVPSHLAGHGGAVRRRAQPSRCPRSWEEEGEDRAEREEDDDEEEEEQGCHRQQSEDCTAAGRVLWRRASASLGAAVFF